MANREERRIKDDQVLLQRIDGLQSTLEQAWARFRANEMLDREAAESLEELAQFLERARDADRPKGERLRLVTQVDAELCMYEPTALLRADRIRLDDRMFRLYPGPRKAWQANLARFDDGKGDEREYRQLLRYLTYEVTQAAGDYERLAAVRRRVLTIMVMSVVVIVFVLGCFFVRELRASFALLGGHASGSSAATAVSSPPVPPPAAISPPAPVASAVPPPQPASPPAPPESRDKEDPGAHLVRSLPAPIALTMLLAGMLGALLFVFNSMLGEKLRPENKWIILANILARVAFGALYAIVVVFALLTDVLPFLKVPKEGPELLMYLVIAAVAAGVSDKLFGKVISALIEGKPETGSTKEKS